jgi:2-hydroxychromene-2-carboxylate isomerase
MERVEFYFSFRSPFAWLALKKMKASGLLHQVDMEYLPVWPRNGPPAFDTEEKRSYINEDMQRLQITHGIEFAMPTVMDSEWSLPHGAFLVAQDKGHGHAFAEQVCAARFAKDQDVGSAAVIGDIAAQLGLDRDEMIALARHPRTQARLDQALGRFIQAKGFGVPIWVVRNERFWGQDRFDALCARLSSLTKDKTKLAS